MLNKHGNTDESDWDKFLFNMVYLFAAGVAAYHSAVVFMLSDPWYIAVPAALVVDGLTAYSVGMLGKWRNSQRSAGFVGIGLFVIISASAQIIARYEGAGVQVPAILRWISLALVPLSSTGAVVALGAIKYFGHRRTEHPTQALTLAQSEPRSTGDALVGPVESDKIEILDDRKPTALIPALSNMVKRGRGRPPKVSYAKDVEDGPKALTGQAKNDK